MANGKIIQLKELDDLSTPIYPVTKADAVYLQNGSLLTDYLRGFPQTTIGKSNQLIYLNNGVLTAGDEVYSKAEIDAKTQDYVLEQNVNYRKWSSGILEQWGYSSPETLNSYTTWGSKYGFQWNISFVMAFVNTPNIIQVTPRLAKGRWHIVGGTWDHTATSFRVYTLSDITSVIPEVYWYARGYWK